MFAVLLGTHFVLPVEFIVYSTPGSNGSTSVLFRLPPAEAAVYQAWLQENVPGFDPPPAEPPADGNGAPE